MTATSKGAKTRRVVVVRRNSSRKKYTPPKLPNKPPVAKGPKSYGRTKNGKYIVVRFFISDRKFRRRKGKSLDIWHVIDFGEGIAKGTKLEGYPRAEAIQIARELRDTYGAWARSEF